MHGASALSAASLLGIPSRAAAEPPPEVTKIRLVKIPAICLAPEYLAEELLRLEGFTDIEYVGSDRSVTHELITRNLADMTATAPPELLPALDTGGEIVCPRVFTAAATGSSCTSTSVRFAISRQAYRRKRDRLPRVLFSGQHDGYVSWTPQGYRLGELQDFDGMRRDFIRERVDAFWRFPAPQAARKKIGRVIVAPRKTARGNNTTAA
jgi:hypothetical protein